MRTCKKENTHWLTLLDISPESESSIVEGACGKTETHDTEFVMEQIYSVHGVWKARKETEPAQGPNITFTCTPYNRASLHLQKDLLASATPHACNQEFNTRNLVNIPGV